ncbi:MAG TPA: hypothetical protein VEG40_09395 [Gaiellaceae bacterium]|nr:hypothetical protein [Gaiellaceae bacterium]
MTKWALANGNWDDPVSGHNYGNPGGLLAFAFDFIHPKGGDVRAARGGHVYDLDRGALGPDRQTRRIARRP